VYKEELNHKRVVKQYGKGGFWIRKRFGICPDLNLKNIQVLRNGQRFKEAE
jgi:hypothetical protein